MPQNNGHPVMGRQNAFIRRSGQDGKHLLEYLVYVTQEGQVIACPFTYDMSMLAAQLGNKDELTYFVYLSKYQKKNLKLYLSV